MSLFTTDQENYIQHEVRLRVVESTLAETIKSMNDEFKALRKENFNHFIATIGILIALFGGVMLTKFIENNHTKEKSIITEQK